MMFIKSYLADNKCNNLTSLSSDRHRFINDNLNKKNNFIDILNKVNDEDDIFEKRKIINEIDNCDNSDITFYLNSINNLDELNDIGIMNILDLISVILNKMCDMEKITSDQMISLERIIHNIDHSMYVCKCNTPHILEYLKSVGTSYEELKNSVLSRPCKPLFVPKSYICEGVINCDGDINSTIANTDPNKIIGDIFNTKHDEWLVNKIDDIYTYYNIGSKNSEPSNMDSKYTVCELNTLVLLAYVYKTMSLNSNGLIKLKETIDKIRKSASENRVEFINHLDNISNNISSVINDESKKAMLDNSPLHDIGFGDIYKFIPDDKNDLYDIDQNKLNEAFSYNYDTMCILSESIFSSRRSVSKNKVEKELRDEHMRKVQELEDRRMADEYDMKHVEKVRKRQFKAELKERKKAARLEEKLNDRKEAKDSKYEGKVNLKDYYNTSKFTNMSIYKLNRALKRLLTAAVAGGTGVMIGLNPAFLAITALLAKRIKQGNKDERHELFVGLHDQLSYIKEKREIALRNGNNKSALQLKKMEDRLKRMCASASFGMPTREKMF